MKELFLHIGMHKTGSSSIQDSLGNASEYLKEYDIWYPYIESFNHTYTFTPIFSNDPLKDITFLEKGIITYEKAQIEQDRMKSLWETELVNLECTKTIISAEGCSMLRLEKVKEMKDFLTQYFDKITVLMYVRDPRSFYSSVLQQQIKHMNVSMDSFTVQKPNQLFTRRLPQYVEVFGLDNIIVRPFNTSKFKNNDLLDDFIYSLGLDIDTSKISRIKSNESLGFNTTVLLSELNKKYPGYVQGEFNLKRGLVKNLGKVIEIFSRNDNKKFHVDFKFTNEEVLYLNNEIQYINQFLKIEDHIQEVKSSQSQSRGIGVPDLDSEYLIDLVNEYNKELEILQNKLDDISKDNVSEGHFKRTDGKSSKCNIGHMEYISGWHIEDDMKNIWSGPEPNSTLRVYVEDEEFGFLLLRFRSFISNDIQETLKISVDGQTVEFLVDNQNGNYLIPLQKNKNNFFDITLSTENTYSPKQLGLGNDSRKLGFVIEKVELMVFS